MQNRPNYLLALAFVMILVGCAGAEEQEAEAAGVAAPAAVPSSPVQDTLPAELSRVRLQLRQMQGVPADSLRMMLPAYRQMFSGMMDHMGGEMGHMRGMPMMGGDSAWVALMDSLHRDVAGIADAQNLPAEALERWMAAHHARAMRMFEMYPRLRRPMR